MTGSATRVSSLLMGLPKEYDLLVQFGAMSLTATPPGSSPPGVLGQPRLSRVTAKDVVGVLDRFRGRITQRVPHVGRQGRR